MGVTYSDLMKKEVTPNWREEPKFEPAYGFVDGRKERECVASEAEMMASGLAPEFRDYCSHKLIDFYKCRRDHFPWVLACKHEKHAWEECQFDDWVIRMKEYERERRLMERTTRKSSRGSSEEMEE